MRTPQLLSQPNFTSCALQGDFVRSSTAEYLSLVSKPKSASCASAAFMLKFLVRAACPEFNRYLAEMIGEDRMFRILK